MYRTPSIPTCTLSFVMHTCSGMSSAASFRLCLYATRSMNGNKNVKPGGQRAAVLAQSLDDIGALLRHDDRRLGRMMIASTATASARTTPLDPFRFPLKSSWSADVQREAVDCVDPRLAEPAGMLGRRR